MPTIDVLTATCRPELVEHVRWMVARQDVDAQIRHHVLLQPKMIDGRDVALDLLHAYAVACFVIVDDDDYVGPGVFRRLLRGLIAAQKKGRHGYAELPRRHYLMSGGYGVSEARRKHFQTFTMKRNAGSGIAVGPHVDDLIIIRGLMADPSTANMPHKNVYSEKHWPHKDPDFSVLREWLKDDPEAFDRYMALRPKEACPA